MKALKLTLAERALSYDIRIGRDILKNLGRLLKELDIAKRYVVITDSLVSPLYGGAVLRKLKKTGLEADLIGFPAGEASKNIATALYIVRQLIKSGADRKTALIALGGGVAGDMTGFVASFYMRSIPYIQVPTTLVAQVDSSIGGKTAIDLEEGKNLLGAFYQPAAVFTDPCFLDTLPDEELANGLAEIVKYGIIEKGGLFRFLEKNISAIRKRKEDALLKVIEMSCAIKKRLVEIDERDQGPRRFLNFGHTIGHALEAASGYGLSHGMAVSIGMIAAIRLSEKVCGLRTKDREEMEDLIKKAGLAVSIPGNIDTDGILSRLHADKKKSGRTINFVLIKEVGEPFVKGGIPKRILRETIEELKR